MTQDGNFPAVQGCLMQCNIVLLAGNPWLAMADGASIAHPNREIPMKFSSLTTSALILTLGVSASAFAQMSSMPAGVKSMGGMLTDAKGMTLYTFDKDAAGKSNCNGQCLVNWPALTADANAKPMGDWTVITRDDGTKQWALKGKPLYTFVQDKKAGDMAGEGKGGVWHMAMP
jgi:predicted lipoprotein with Yx(FWY)xxD motif